MLTNQNREAEHFLIFVYTHTLIIELFLLSKVQMCDSQLLAN